MIPTQKDIRQILPAGLVEKLPQVLARPSESCGQLYLTTTPTDLLELCRFLRDDADWLFNFLSLVSGVDWLGRQPRFEVVYHLRSFLHNYRVGIKVPVPEESPSVPSVTSLWSTADWLEREVFDLYGIRFDDHPNLKRIMMPDDWEGHPYRKDYPLEG